MLNVHFSVCFIIADPSFAQKETNEPVYYQDLYPLSDVQQTPGTTHISVMDRDGNAVALTSTVRICIFLAVIPW